MYLMSLNKTKKEKELVWNFAKFCTLWYIVADYDCCLTLEWILSAKKLDSTMKTDSLDAY